LKSKKYFAHIPTSPLLKAFVLSERADSKLSKELAGLCRKRLARFKIPKAFEVVSELPRTPTGKLKRFVLRGDPRSQRS
jgi:acyl-coenzyme A synthetase/AMP-(fatty) acid ligase